MSEAGDGHVIVVGAGPAGLVTALALTREGATVTLVGEPPPEARGRTVALFDGSVRFLAELGLWDALAAKAAPLRKLRIIDDTDNLFRWPALTFDADEIGLDAFGWNVESRALSTALRRQASSTPGIRLIGGLASEPRFGGTSGRSQAGDIIDLASVMVGGRRLEAELMVAADGQRSQLRQAAGITTRTAPLRQSALIAILRHELPHEDVSTEFHKRGGPCTLVPLAPVDPEDAEAGPGDAHLPHASSLVWMMQQDAAATLQALDDAEFALAVERSVHSSLGKMRILGARGAVPLSSLHVARIVAPRLALVGEAAHAFPPIGAQGLNLGLRDASSLAARVGAALRDGEDIGGPDLLGAYERDRRGDIATRGAVVAMMNRSLLSSFLPADLARGLGMAALDLIGPLRRLVMRQGIEPGLGRRRTGA